MFSSFNPKNYNLLLWAKVVGRYEWPVARRVNGVLFQANFYLCLPKIIFILVPSSHTVSFIKSKFCKYLIYSAIKVMVFNQFILFCYDFAITKANMLN